MAGMSTGLCHSTQTVIASKPDTQGGYVHGPGSRAGTLCGHPQGLGDLLESQGFIENSLNFDPRTDPFGTPLKLILIIVKPRKQMRLHFIADFK